MINYEKSFFDYIINIDNFSWGCKGESYIKKEIDKAGYCKVDSDCVLIGSRCPLGCYAAINMNENVRINELIQSYKPKFSECVYSCLRCENVVCIDNKCREVCE